MVPTLLFVIYIYPADGWTIYLHEAWDHCTIIDGWAVQSLKTVIDDGSHAFFIMYTERREQGGLSINILN